MEKLDKSAALNRAAAYCSKSEHCISEVQEKLRLWGMEPDQQQEILQWLIKEKFIDESRFCRSFINDKYKYNKWGRIKIAYALKMKRIPSELIYSSIDEYIEPELYRNNLESLLRDKRKSIRSGEWNEICAKLFRFAASRGFETEEITPIVKQLRQ